MPPPAETETTFLDSPWRVPLPVLGLLIAATLVGLGVILWIAANWQEFGKAGRFALVAGTMAAAGGLSVASARLRVPAALLGLFAIGGLFALFGQTYQSSADAYELFAIWAAVALPWVLAARHDAVWCFWVIIAFTALPLWIITESQFHAPDLATVLPAWAIALVIAAALSPWSRLHQWTGPTRWAFRLAVVLTLGLIVSYALPDLVTRHVGGLGLLGLVVAAAMVAGFA